MSSFKVKISRNNYLPQGKIEDRQCFFGEFWSNFQKNWKSLMCPKSLRFHSFQSILKNLIVCGLLLAKSGILKWFPSCLDSLLRSRSGFFKIKARNRSWKKIWYFQICFQRLKIFEIVFKLRQKLGQKVCEDQNSWMASHVLIFEGSFGLKSANCWIRVSFSPFELSRMLQHVSSL